MSTHLTTPTLRSITFLRQVLLADAVVSAATGLLMFALAGTLAGLLALPELLLRAAGLVLLPYAAFVAYAAREPGRSRRAVWTIVACNLLWAADCLLLLATGWVQPTALGVAFILTQVLAVGLFGELQYVGLRRLQAAAA